MAQSSKIAMWGLPFYLSVTGLSEGSPENGTDMQNGVYHERNS